MFSPDLNDVQEKKLRYVMAKKIKNSYVKLSVAFFFHIVASVKQEKCKWKYYIVRSLKL